MTLHPTPNSPNSNTLTGGFCGVSYFPTTQLSVSMFLSPSKIEQIYLKQHSQPQNSPHKPAGLDLPLVVRNPMPQDRRINRVIIVRADSKMLTVIEIDSRCSNQLRILLHVRAREQRCGNIGRGAICEYQCFGLYISWSASLNASMNTEPTHRCSPCSHPQHPPSGIQKPGRCWWSLGGTL